MANPPKNMRLRVQSDRWLQADFLDEDAVEHLVGHKLDGVKGHYLNLDDLMAEGLRRPDPYPVQRRNPVRAGRGKEQAPDPSNRLWQLRDWRPLEGLTSSM